LSIIDITIAKLNSYFTNCLLSGTICKLSYRTFLFFFPKCTPAILKQDLNVDDRKHGISYLVFKLFSFSSCYLFLHAFEVEIFWPYFHIFQILLVSLCYLIHLSFVLDCGWLSLLITNLLFSISMELYKIKASNLRITVIFYILKNLWIWLVCYIFFLSSLWKIIKLGPLVIPQDNLSEQVKYEIMRHCNQHRCALKLLYSQ